LAWHDSDGLQYPKPAEIQGTTIYNPNWTRPVRNSKISQFLPPSKCGVEMASRACDQSGHRSIMIFGNGVRIVGSVQHNDLERMEEEDESGVRDGGDSCRRSVKKNQRTLRNWLPDPSVFKNMMNLVKFSKNRLKFI
jgi:hypothetical protein